MELGLSLGDSSKDSKPFKISTKDSNSEHHGTAITNKQDGLVFCMALGVNSTAGNQESHENYDQDDDHQQKLMGTPVQLDLLPLAPVPRHTESPLPVSGSSENGLSRQLGLLQPVVACGAAEEEVLSGNDVMEAERTSSRASDEDENSHKSRKKLRLSKEQSAYLEENFKEHSTLNPKQKLALAKHLNLRPRQVEVWFQNRRARTKLKQTEVDCEYLKRYCDSLTEENKRLHKELQDLRALNSSNPFSMQLPATTLTMCPSCERVATTTTTSSATATTTPAASPPISKTSTIESKPKVVQFPLFRPKLYPFSCSPTHSHQSAAS